VTPLEISPPQNAGNSVKSTVTVNNIKPGEKIKVTVVEGNALPKPSATPKASKEPTTSPTKSTFVVTSKDPVKVVPKPTGSSAGFGLSNLKPGQKIKVTVKTGGTQK
jgi:hypothetical protein